MGKKIDAIVLVSGGIDSTACLYYYLKNKFNVRALFIDYGQTASKQEYKSIKKIIKYYNIKLDVIKVKMATRFGKGEIKGRNAFFPISVLMKYPIFSGIISLGIHANVPYYDSTIEFVSDINNLLNKYANGTVKVDAPFISWDKNMILKYCKKNKVPIKFTYSCELGKKFPCGECNSCLERKALNACSM